MRNGNVLNNRIYRLYRYAIYLLLFTRAIRKAFCRRLYRHFVALRCFATPWLRLQDAMIMEMVLPTYIHAGRFSCETENRPQECTSELQPPMYLGASCIMCKTSTWLTFAALQSCKHVDLLALTISYTAALVFWSRLSLIFSYFLYYKRVLYPNCFLTATEFYLFVIFLSATQNVCKYTHTEIM